jgi:hypothetical protein
MKNMEAGSSLAIIGHEGGEEEQRVPSAIPTDQWQVTFSRFINYPSLPSTCPSLIPLPHNRKFRPTRGTWISSVSATASLQLLNYQSNSKDAILGLSLNGTVLVSSIYSSFRSNRLKVSNNLVYFWIICRFFKYELNLLVQEEHYVWKLHFSWPQVSCVSGYPSRGTRAVFVTFKDSLDEVGNIIFDFFCHE